MNDGVSWQPLWDQMSNLNDEAGKGIETMDRTGSLAKDLAMIQQEFASKLKALHKKHYWKMKNENELINSLSCNRGFNEMVDGLIPIAVQHESIAENLKTNVIPFANQKATEYRMARKQMETDNNNIHKQLNAAVNEMVKANKDYGKNFKETEAAMLKYAKAEKNMEISRLELEKTKNNYQQKCGMLEESKQTYAAMTHRANEEQAAHFDVKLPQLLENYKKLHFNRIIDTVELFNKVVEAEASVISIIASCHNDMRHNIAKIDPVRDANLVVENLKSGHPRPAPFAFEDMGNPKTFLAGGGGGSIETIDSTLKKGTLLGKKDGKGVARKQSMHQKFFGGGNNDKKDTGDYGTLPPQQRARKLQAKISELDKEKERASQSLEGVMKMQNAYRENPKLGNPAHCEAQISQYGKEIEALNNQIQKFHIQLDEVNSQLIGAGSGGFSASSIGGSDTPPSIRSVSSASSGVTSRVNTINDGHRAANGGSERRESGSGSDNDPSTNGNGNGIRDELYEEMVNPPNPVIGEGIAQFAFDGAQDGAIRMESNEKLWIIEKDEGDGWTRVRKCDNSADGFVPSSYLKIQYYNGR